MNKIWNQIFVLIITLVFACFLSPLLSHPIFATSVVWTKSNGIGSYSQEIRISRSSPNIVYATTRTSAGSGLFKSIDGGKNFVVKFPITPNRDVNSIAISYFSSDKLCIGTYEQGVFCSNDGGGTFDNSGWVSSGGSGKKVRFVTVDPTNDNIYFAGTGESNGDGGIYKTTDFGHSWVKVGQSTFGDMNCLNIVVDSNNNQRIFAGQNNGLSRSLNGGLDWTSLPIPYQTNHPSTIIDGNSPSKVFAGTVSNGVYFSNNDGDTWIARNVGIQSAFIFRLAQNSDNVLYASNRRSPGGVWKSIDEGITWENISDPAWATQSTNNDAWGLDVINNRIVASIGELGIFYADTIPSPPSPSPVIFLPGFGGSWSYKGLVENQATVASDWTILPFADPYYQPLLTTLKNAGLTDSGVNQNLFTFAYDYRKSITDTAVVLNNYLDTVISQNPGKKVNLVTHSMGGLVARQCFEKVTGCAGKIDKIVTSGGPHQGTIKAYQLWEAGELDVSDLLTKTAVEIALHVTNLPYLSDKDIIQNRFPGVRDLLPISLVSNPNLQALIPVSSPFSSTTYPLSGNNTSTKNSFTTVARSSLDTALGLWSDGKPGVYSFAVGDGTITKTSAEILSSANNKYYAVDHVDYFRNSTVMADILNILGLPATPLPSLPPNPPSFLSFLIHSPATIVVKDQNGNAVGTNVGGQAVFITNPTNQNYQITLTGTGNGSLQLDSFYSNTSGSSKKTYNGSITTGATATVNYQNYDFSASLASFRAKVAATNNRGLATIEAGVVVNIANIQANRNRAAAFLNLENAYLNIWKLVVTENNGSMRQNLKECADQLQSLLVGLNAQYRSNPASSLVTAEITRAQNAVNLKSAKISLTSREAANLDLAKKQLAAAVLSQSSGSNYSAILSSRPATILSQ